MPGLFLDASTAAFVPTGQRSVSVLARLLRRRADKTGDCFAFSGAQKYVDRLGRRFSEGDAGRTFKLLRDPLNFALAKRDEGADQLRGARTAGPGKARLAFEAAREAARACESPATELKSLVGLVASGEVLTPGQLKTS